MEIRSIQGPQGLDAIGATAAPPPEDPKPSFDTTPASSLDPAVKVDIGSHAYQPRFVRDVDTGSIVFQVVDSNSGDVVDQLPSENALRNRAYATSTAQSAETKPASLSRVA